MSSDIIRLPEFHARTIKIPTRFRYLPNHGNAGDAVIGMATDLIFGRDPSSDPEILGTVEDLPLVVGGGGNLVPMYSHLARRLKLLPASAEVIILPSTTFGHWKLLSRFERIHLYCREKETFRQAELHGIPSTLTHDLAFSIDYSQFEVDEFRNSLPLLHAFRVDAESSGRTTHAALNRDLSLEWPQNVWSFGRSEIVARAFISAINRYKAVKTDRLHIGIVATLLGKSVEFHGNSYYKNKEVYKNSLVYFSNCKWVER